MGCLLHGVLLAQEVQNGLLFEHKSHYWGTFSRTEGSKNHAFEYENTSDAPIIISRVKATCGCTAVEWEKKPIMPGEKGRVEVQFNPDKFSGYFNKKVSVYTNASSKPIDLKVSGRIRVNRMVKDQFNHFLGVLKSNKNLLDFGELEKNDEKLTQHLQMINITRDTVFFEILEVPKGMEAKQTSNKIVPGGRCSLEVSFVPNEMDVWGHMKIPLLVSVKRGMQETIEKLPIKCSFIDCFSMMSEEEKENAPIPEIIMDTEEIILESMKPGKEMSLKILVKNNGKAPLILRSIELPNESFIMKKYDRQIEAGKTGEIRVLCKEEKDFEQGNEEKLVLWTNSPKAYRIEKKILRKY